MIGSSRLFTANTSGESTDDSAVTSRDRNASTGVLIYC